MWYTCSYSKNRCLMSPFYSFRVRAEILLRFSWWRILLSSPPQMAKELYEWWGGQSALYLYLSISSGSGLKEGLKKKRISTKAGWMSERCQVERKMKCLRGKGKGTQPRKERTFEELFDRAQCCCNIAKKNDGQEGSRARSWRNT